MSSPLRRLAEQIPAEYRREMLQLNLIDSAKAVPGDEAMHYLIVIWQNYVEKDFTPDCNLCRSRVLTNMKNLRAEFIALEKDSNLLKSL